MEIQFHNIGNRMISSAIWDKSAQVIFFTSADLLPNCTRKILWLLVPSEAWREASL